jgi:hypothetical protein
MLTPLASFTSPETAMVMVPLDPAQATDQTAAAAAQSRASFRRDVLRVGKGEPRQG